MMEQILAFVLGVLFVPALACVYNMFRTNRRLNKLEVDNDFLISNIEAVERNYISDNENINRRIDQEIDRVDNLHREVLKYIDSRTDKNSAKIDDLLEFTDLSQHATEKLQIQLAELQVDLENYINKQK
jgi:hypothetical protein